ncbi:peptide-methionine (R)-S-oxide reductase MsrB [Nibribacter ruber]|uniref:peptide-methionine (R)-S-oxide reductase n=1 Tax=Nibribacter ruber TaxID=2698458 RepID=A0A6P1NSJ4_9BACT|nr:peptide-methionine (R)-S-oxide reductase MsrB [Nibribacter ruber]QHL85990.1 peptide-methionine (R)-S-oxide reductase MsrB [Nibribacter ruber]
MLRWKDIISYAKYGNPEPPRRVEQTEEQWQQRLSPAQYAILRERGTEPPYRNAFCKNYEPGDFSCAGCGSLLFSADTKYHAISGWPSFTQPVSKAACKYLFDDSHHMHRVEVRCNVCNGHLGHVSPDGPAPAGLRFCLNSASLIKHTLPID